MFPQLKARRAGVPPEGTTPARPAQATRFGVPARAVRPLGFAAVAVAAAVTVAGCKPGTLSSASGSQFGSTSSSSLTSQALQLAAQQTQQVNSLNAGLQIQATGGLNASLVGNLNEVLSPTPMISVTGNAGSLGHVRIILDNGTAYLRSPFVTHAYGKPWIMGSYAGMSSSSGLNLGSLLGLLQASNPMTQTQLFGYGTNLRVMGHASWDGARMHRVRRPLHAVVPAAPAQLQLGHAPDGGFVDEQRHPDDPVPGLDGLQPHGAQAGADRGGR